MSREIRLFGLAGLCLLIFGGVLIYLSGEVTSNVMNRQPTPTVIRAVTAIVVTQTREPVDKFAGKWACTGQDAMLITIEKSGSFYDVLIDQQTLIGTVNGEEIKLEDNSAMRLNNNHSKLLVNTADGAGITCTRAP